MLRRSFHAVALAILWSRVAAQSTPTTTYWEPSPPTNTPCSKLELVIARGTGEPGEYGEGVGDPLFNATKAQIPGVSAYPVNYPANWTLGVSIGIGVNDTVNHLLEQSAKCPDQVYALVGYSQGALVAHSAVVSTSLNSSFLQEKVIAFVVYGDPDAKGPGAPGAIDLLPKVLQSRVKNNCECGDTYCSNGTSAALHISYVDPSRGYHPQTAQYIKKALDTNGDQGTSVITTYDLSENCTLQYCSNTTAGGPPKANTQQQCQLLSGGSTSTSGNSTSPGATGTGGKPSGTGTGTGSGSGTGSPSVSPISTSGATSLASAALLLVGALLLVL